MNVTYERNAGRPIFRTKVDQKPPLPDPSDSFPVSEVAKVTDNKANITLEELASDSSILSEPNYRFDVQGVFLNQVSSKNQFPTHTFNCCSGPDCETKTYNNLSKILEDFASTPTPIKLPEPIFINVAEQLTLRSSSTKPKDCCEDCRLSTSSSSIPTNLDPHDNSNNSTGAPSFSSFIPSDGEQLGSNEFEGGNLKNGSVDTDTKTDPVKQSCCVIS